MISVFLFFLLKRLSEILKQCMKIIIIAVLYMNNEIDINYSKKNFSLKISKFNNAEETKMV